MHHHDQQLVTVRRASLSCDYKSVCVCGVCVGGVGVCVCGVGGLWCVCGGLWCVWGGVVWCVSVCVCV